MKRSASIAVFVPVVLALIAVDRLSKAWAAANLYAGVAELDLGPINLTLVHNTGAAFGIGEGSTYVFIAIAACIVTLIVAWLAGVRWHSKLEVFSLALVAAGGVGNLIDRVQWGYVVDFIEFTFIEFPVFNVADICVTCGVALFIIAILFCMDLSFEGPDGEDDGGPRETGAVEAAATEPQATAGAASPQAAAEGADDAPPCAAPWAPPGAGEPDAPLTAGLAAADLQAPAAAAAEDAAPAPELSPLDVEGVLAAHGKTASARVERAAVEARYYDSPASYGPQARVQAAAGRPAGGAVAGPARTASTCAAAPAPAASEPAASPEPAGSAAEEPRYGSVAAELLAELRTGSQEGTGA